jgi:hypothetical protein
MIENGQSHFILSGLTPQEGGKWQWCETTATPSDDERIMQRVSNFHTSATFDEGQCLFIPVIQHERVAAVDKDLGPKFHNSAISVAGQCSYIPSIHQHEQFGSADDENSSSFAPEAKGTGSVETCSCTVRVV